MGAGKGSILCGLLSVHHLGDQVTEVFPGQEPGAGIPHRGGEGGVAAEDGGSESVGLGAACSARADGMHIFL